MIKIIKGDLLKATENIIGHSCNCMGVMGSGVALQIKKKYPIVFEKYTSYVDKYIFNGEDLRKELLGQMQTVKVDKGKYIANLFGQLNYGTDGKQYTNTEALFQSFLTLKKGAMALDLSVALPYMIGCYRGGADWKEVENLILTAFDDYEVTLYKL